mgnify:CR=1 FL=1
MSAGEIELARGDQPPLISYDGLCVRLTATMIFSDGLGVDHSLSAASWKPRKPPKRAEAMVARDKAVNSYKKLVKAKSGRSITRANAKYAHWRKIRRRAILRFVGCFDRSTAQRSITKLLRSELTLRAQEGAGNTNYTNYTNRHELFVIIRAISVIRVPRPFHYRT